MQVLEEGVAQMHQFFQLNLGILTIESFVKKG